MDKTIELILDKILDEGAVKMTDKKFQFSKIDGNYFISKNQGGGLYKTTHEFSDLVVALDKYCELVTE